MTRRRPPLAATADRHALYQRAVQLPANDVALFVRTYRRLHGRLPRVLREDFCGTAAVACTWARSSRDRTAWGVDLDVEPLVWGAFHNRRPLPAEAAKRVQLVQGNVLHVRLPAADVVAAQNFSFCVFKTRRELKAYFRAAYRALGRRGILVLDVLGGAETQNEGHETERPIVSGSRIRYVWEQKRFDPIAARARFAIHFRFPDGSRLAEAFTYDWRLWSIPEIRELLAEAGFRASEVLWEGRGPRGGGDGVFRPRRSAPAEACWVSIVIGIKGP